MADFLYHYRERWDEHGVVGFCGYKKAGDTSDDCMAYSVPKGPFWRNLNVSFDPDKIRTVNKRDANAVSMRHRIRPSLNPFLETRSRTFLPACRVPAIFRFELLG